MHRTFEVFEANAWQQLEAMVSDRSATAPGVAKRNVRCIARFRGKFLLWSRQDEVARRWDRHAKHELSESFLRSAIDSDRLQVKVPWCYWQNGELPDNCNENCLRHSIIFKKVWWMKKNVCSKISKKKLTPKTLEYLSKNNPQWHITSHGMFLFVSFWKNTKVSMA